MLDARDRLVQARVERLAGGVEGPHLVAFQLLLQQPQRQVDALDQRGPINGAGAVAARLHGDRALQVIDHLEHVLQHALARLRHRVRLVLARPLLEILELGRDPEHPILRLVALGGQRGQLFLRRRLGKLGRAGGRCLGRRAFGHRPRSSGHTLGRRIRGRAGSVRALVSGHVFVSLHFTSSPCSPCPRCQT